MIDLTIDNHHFSTGGRSGHAIAVNGSVPGPLIRLREGQEVTLNVTNNLDEDSSIHWHGLRLPNAMDGVPGMTQAPVAPGDSFDYRFTLPDAGTFWYHPHFQSAEQQDRGLAGAIIVEDEKPLPVDRDLLWVLSVSGTSPNILAAVDDSDWTGPVLDSARQCSVGHAPVPVLTVTAGPGQRAHQEPGSARTTRVSRNGM